MSGVAFLYPPDFWLLVLHLNLHLGTDRPLPPPQLVSSVLLPSTTSTPSLCCKENCSACTPSLHPFFPFAPPVALAQTWSSLMPAMCQVMLKKETPCLAPCWISGNGGGEFFPRCLLFLQFTRQNTYSLFTVAHSVSENQDAVSQEGRHNHKTRTSRNQKQQISCCNIICGERISHVHNCNVGAQVMSFPCSHFQS